jgi:autotransporter strand-loop-strand O-heptosyltransferase
MGYTQFTEDVFVVDCWPDNKDKENVLKELLTRLKVYNCPIILCGHYPVNSEIQKLADYFIYDSNNDILLEKDYLEYGVNSDRWTDLGDYKIINKVDFHHDYAIWLTMKNAFNLVKQLGKKYIHFIEYDNLPDEIQYRQAFMEYIRSNDAVVYEYSEGSTREENPYSSTYIFSIKTETALELVSKINTKEEYFKNKPNRWQLEKVFYQTLKSITNSIFVSKYVPNNNELNIFAAWNRNGITKNGARLQTYLGVDDFNQLYIHFISGFSEKPADKDYLIEINYNGLKTFKTIKKGEYTLNKIGTYVEGESVEIFYQGITIFEQKLNDEVDEFRRKNKIIRKDKPTNRKVNYNFVDGPFVEIIEDGDYLYNIEFINKKNNKVEYNLNLKSNHWARTSKKYFVDWLIKIKGIDNDFYQEYELDLTNKRVMVCFESKSLGDSLAWIPYVDEFGKVNNCEMICSSFNNDLFKGQYPNVTFVEPGSVVNNVYALYRLGLFYDNKRKIDYSRHLTDPKKEPLMKVASDILGLKYKELKPLLPKLGKKKKKLVSIAIHSTSQCKYWNNPTGWQEVVDFLKGEGYEVRLLSKEEDGYMGNKHPKGITTQPKGTLKDLIKVLQESEFFIGISSGLSWLSWASGTPTVIISGFTDVDLEPLDGVTRIINKNVCNSCWSDYEFDPGNWNWCPINEGTERLFECSKTITGTDVIKEINKLMKIS